MNPISPPTRRDRPVLSPLRYPGGKRRLAPYIEAVLDQNDLRPDLFVEPFAGGASVALEMLLNDRVERIALSDSDPLIAAFWETVFDLSPQGEKNFEWLIRRVENCDLDLETWDAMKTTNWKATKTRALACLYLNRTSFNGSLYRTAGPIGGRKQGGDYKVGARFPRKRIVTRLRACRDLADRVHFVRCEDAMRVVKSARDECKANNWKPFFYLDPPFWAKAKWLYSRWFSEMEHEELAQQLKFLREPWVLSYDTANEIRELYADHDDAQTHEVELFYSGMSQSAGSELIITNLPKSPASGRLFWTNVERREARDARLAVQAGS